MQVCPKCHHYAENPELERKDAPQQPAATSGAGSAAAHAHAHGQHSTRQPGAAGSGGSSRASPAMATSSSARSTSGSQGGAAAPADKPRKERVYGLLRCTNGAHGEPGACGIMWARDDAAWRNIALAVAAAYLRLPRPRELSAVRPVGPRAV